MYQEVKEQIKLHKDINYRNFTCRLLPGIKNIEGVRIPILRKIAKEIVKNNPYEFLKDVRNETFEETMIEGLVIGYLKDEFSNIKIYINRFISKIDNWSICDTFCSNLKITNKMKTEMFKLIIDYLESEKEYENRFSYVMLLNYYVEDNYIDKLFSLLDKSNSIDYYAKMAKAWLIQVCYLKYRDKTIAYLKQNNLDTWTYNKAIQKIIESKKTTITEKKILKDIMGK